MGKGISVLFALALLAVAGFEPRGLLLKDPGVLLKVPGIILKDPGVLLKDLGVL